MLRILENLGLRAFRILQIFGIQGLMGPKPYRAQRSSPARGATAVPAQGSLLERSRQRPYQLESQLLKGGYIGEYIGTTTGVIKGYTWSLDRKSLCSRGYRGGCS